MGRTWKVFVVVAALVGCHTTVKRTTYRVPIANNAEPEAAKTCYRSCTLNRLDGAGDKGYTDCLATCPGIQIREGTGCDPEKDKPPVAYCFTKEEKKTEMSDRGKQILLYILFTPLLALLFVGPTR